MMGAVTSATIPCHRHRHFQISSASCMLACNLTMASLFQTISSRRFSRQQTTAVISPCSDLAIKQKRPRACIT
eukprot:5378560-Karenia_brevis.AAC.1